jgi:hypothetical protein
MYVPAPAIARYSPSCEKLKSDMACLSRVSGLNILSVLTKYALAYGNRPGCDPLAGIEQVYYRVEAPRGEITTAGV